MGSIRLLPGRVGDASQSFAQPSVNLLKRLELNSAYRPDSAPEVSGLRFWETSPEISARVSFGKIAP